MYLILELEIDTLENTLDRAIVYNIIGSCSSLKKAQQIQKKAGVVNGTGWPIMRGQTKPKIIYKKVKSIK